MWLVFSGVYQYGYRGPYWILANNFWQLLLVLTAIYPLVPGAWYPPVGPWWFIPFIMQFYLIWSLGNYLLAKIARPTLIGLTALSVSANFFIVPLVQNKYNINILFTPLGHLPEIFFGIFCARNGVPSAQYILPPAIILLLVSSYSAQFWPLHHISGLLVFLYLCIAIIKQAGQRNSQHFLWLGNYSLGIFLVNGFLREPFVDLSNYFNSWIISILLVVPFFALSCAMAVALTKIIHTIATKKRPKITNTPNAERDD